MPAASPRRHVGQSAMAFAVRPFGDWITTKVKIRVLRVAARPTAGFWGERADLFGGGQAWVGKGGRQGGLFQHRLDEERSGRLRFGAAVCPGGGGDGSLLDLGDRNCPGSQEANHNADAAGDAAIAMLPASHAS